MDNKIKLGIKIYSLSNSNYEFSTEDLDLIENNVDLDSDTSKFLWDFFYVFSAKCRRINNDQMNLEFQAFLSFNSIVKTKLDNFIEHYKNVYPKLNALKKYFTKIGINEYICVLPAYKIIDTKEELEITKILHKLNNKEFPDIDKLFEPVVENYNIYYYGEFAKKIGHANKNDRVCRWCHNTTSSNPAVTFNKRAHAISEALGNKNLYLYDECDTCNEYFAKTIELDFINSIQILNVAWGVHGKKGIPVIRKHNLEIKYLSPETTTNTKSKGVKRNTPPLCSYNAGKITPQNIYRVLCKFALSVLEDEKVLTEFRWTTDWIRNKCNLTKVPKIYNAIMGSFSESNPIVQLHIRKNQDINIPRLFAIFNHRNLAYFFIIPSSEREAEYFANDEILDSFWNTLPYSQYSGWKAEYLSGSIPIETTINLNFIPRKI